jgi:hypothetical protein
MRINVFSITFWFNIFDNHNDILEELKSFFKDEYNTLEVHNMQDNYLAPVITAINNNQKTNFAFSQINFQYNMEDVTFDDFSTFKEKALKILEFLKANGVEVLHTAVFINGEEEKNDALAAITNKTLNFSICSDDLIDVTLKFGKKYEDLFYKIVTLLNKKQLKIPQLIDSAGRNIPIPLISWNGSTIESEIIEISYEMNDKYSFDYTKDYKTTEFYLNKMLFLIEENFKDDIQKLLENGKF